MDTYEKKYNEALERAKYVLHTVETAGCAMHKDLLTEIFPELRESEDERMMREFNDWLCEEIECRTNDLRDEKDRRTLNMLCYILTKVKDWLEKQKEPTTEELYAGAGTTEKEYIANTMKMVRAMRERKKEQKPISQEDFDTAKHEALWDEQKPAWSEEDTLMLTAIIQTLERFGGRGTTGMQIDWLQSLRPSWKPSKEQMEALHTAAYLDEVESYDGLAYRLRELYEQLKKL